MEARMKDGDKDISDSDPDLLDTIIRRAQTHTADELDRRMQDAEPIKAHEEEASRRRLEDMWMREHRRQQAIAEARAEQKRQEQLLVRYVLMGAVVVILIIVVLVLIANRANSTGGPESLAPLVSPYV
jgi:hypothetical protein